MPALPPPRRWWLAASPLSIAAALGVGACGGCPEGLEYPTETTYIVADASDPALIGAHVTVTHWEIVIRYERDGVPITVVYTNTGQY